LGLESAKHGWILRKGWINIREQEENPKNLARQSQKLPKS